ncbi:MAG: hypothetical protein H6739_01945 [Alphaproteobacteria bacterium]|nr:hypothetical protein [Alphaproteobacteria bacterium]
MIPMKWASRTFALLALGACHGKDGTPPVDTSVPLDGLCAEAAERLGILPCVHSVPNDNTWTTITIAASPADQLRATKYMLPIREDAQLPLTYLNANAYTLHYDLMVEGFPDMFPGLTRQEYVNMVLEPTEKRYSAGNLAQYLAPGGGTFYGFTVWDDPAVESRTATYEEVLNVYEELLATFAPEPLVFVPSSSNQIEAAQGWDAPFPIRGVEGGIDYEVYTRGVGYGTVRLYDLGELAAAERSAAFGFQDILVLDEAPLDIERVISGAVTGTRQGELSHLNVRSAARGTPNCFIADPHSALAAWEGRLVRLECGEDDWSVQSATLAEAEAWWEALRPEPVGVPAPDLTTDTFVGLLDLPTDTEAQRAAALAAYGAKGTNLAALYQRIPAEYQLIGFVVPFAWYDRFLQEQGWTVDLGQGEGFHTFAETLDVWLSDETFLNDAAARRSMLTDLRIAIREAPLDPALVSALYDAIVATWGDDTTMVRFRSSSNAEDALQFSGAGLYDSESVCAADSVDGDDEGDSLCDPDQDDERTIERGLRRVWASMWNTEAYEERAWYGIDHRQAVMGILVNTRSKDERANIVAFTGNPTGSDDRTLVNAQIGELDVVSAEPGVYPEKTLVRLDAQGQVSDIDRVNGSSEVPDGFEVLSDGQITELAELYWVIEGSYPLDGVAPEGTTLLLDSEWKVLPDGQLVVKQIRPFLRQD